MGTQAGQSAPGPGSPDKLLRERCHTTRGCPGDELCEERPRGSLTQGASKQSSKVIRIFGSPLRLACERDGPGRGHSGRDITYPRPPLCANSSRSQTILGGQQSMVGKLKPGAVLRRLKVIQMVQGHTVKQRNI